MKRLIILIASMLLLAIGYCVTPRTTQGVDVYGDAEAVGARLYVDGKLVGQLRALVERWTLFAPPGLEPCYAPNDTIARPGEPRVTQTVRMPVGEHRLEVVFAGGESASLQVQVLDSPSLQVWGRCRLVKQLSW